MKPRINIIAALGKNRAIGKRGKLLWRISDDLKRFKRLTLGHPIIMGRKTYESIGRALPGRTNIVVTRNQSLSAPGIIVVHSFHEAMRTAGADEIFIIGGGEIYTQALPRAEKLYLTLVESSAEGDVFFPEYEKEFAKETFRESHTDPTTGLRYTWIDRKRA
jgi:dihydrofolate reductase